MTQLHTRAMNARRRVAGAIARAAMCAFIDDLGRPRLAHLAPRAPSPQRTRLTIEFDPGSEPISGRILDGRGISRRFAGWLGLAAGIDRSLPARPPREPDAA